MEETLVDPVGDFAFAVLDWLLYHAVFEQRQITLRHKRSFYYCYSTRDLRRELTRIAEAEVKRKHNALPADMDTIVTNAMDEYGREIHGCFRVQRAS